VSPPKSRLRLRIEKVLADGQEHSLNEISARACHGLVILPGISARIVERNRRRQTPDQERRRNRELPPEVIMWSGERHLVRTCLNDMIRRGRVERVRPGIYRAISVVINDHADSGDKAL
jgi:hypothetical protein